MCAKSQRKHINLLYYVINTKLSAYSYTEIADAYYKLCYFAFTLSLLFNRIDNFMAFNRQYLFSLKYEFKKSYWSLCYKILYLVLCTLTDQKRLESFEMWCWRRMEKISWTDRVRNEEVLLRVNEQRNFLHEVRKRKANWIGHILRRNCLLQQVIEGKIKGQIEVTRRRGKA